MKKQCYKFFINIVFCMFTRLHSLFISRVMIVVQRKRNFPAKSRISLEHLLDRLRSPIFLPLLSLPLLSPSLPLLSIRIFVVRMKKFAARSTKAKQTKGTEARDEERDGRRKVRSTETKRGRAGVWLRGSVVKRIDPNHYDMSRLRFAASMGTMAGSLPKSKTATWLEYVCQ